MNTGRIRLTALSLLITLLGPLSSCVRPSTSALPPHLSPAMPPSKLLTKAVEQTPASPVRFMDIARTAGLNYRWKIAGTHPLDILRTMGSGCAFLDYNNDGNLDILLIGTKPALYQGDGKGHFRDVTKETGLDRISGHFFGCAVGDYDNDGYPDIYISGYHTGVLLHNEPSALTMRGHEESAGVRTPQAESAGRLAASYGPRVFHDVTRAMGLKPQPWGTSCGFADLNSDGYLDLYIANYVDFDPARMPRLCPDHGVAAACGPRSYRGLKGVLYFNEGGRHFRDGTRESGAAMHSGNGLGVAFADYDGSGHVSLAIANDELSSNLFQNMGGGRLREVGIPSGMALNNWGSIYAGMGVDWGDYDNDGRPDLFVATYHNEPKSLFHNNGNGTFTDRSQNNGIARATLSFLAFGAKFVDADNDGWLDILIANGHVEDNVQDISKDQRYRQPIQLLRNLGGADPQFEDISAVAGLNRLPTIVGRGLAIGDFDNDGRMDALAVDGEGAPLLLHNTTPGPGHWIGFKLMGTGGSNRDGYGAQVTVTLSNGQTRMRQSAAGGSYLSSSDARVHVGLGKQRIKSVLVRWPDGLKEMWKALKEDRYVTLVEGQGLFAGSGVGHSLQAEADGIRRKPALSKLR